MSMIDQDKDKMHEAVEESTVETENKEGVQVLGDTEISEKSDSFKEQLLRVTADFQNYKRRVEKDRAVWMQTAQVSVIKSLLTFLDDMERALEANKGLKEGENNLYVGFELIYKNVIKTLADLGLKELPAEGEFNPHYHEALMQADSSEHQSGHIVQVLSKGYEFKGEIVRHAKVSVAR